MATQERSIAANVRIITISVTTTATTIKSLLETALGTISKTWAAELGVRPIGQVGLIPAANMTAVCTNWAGELSLSSGTERNFQVFGALEDLKLVDSAGPHNCVVILYLM